LLFIVVSRNPNSAKTGNFGCKSLIYKEIVVTKNTASTK